MSDPIITHIQRVLADHPEGEEIAALLVAARERGEHAQQLLSAERDQHERDLDSLHALAWVLADIMDGVKINDVVDDLPYDARRLVIACRHQGSPIGFATGRDQFGRLPVPRPRASVMRDRVRTVDAEASWENNPREDLRQLPG